MTNNLTNASSAHAATNGPYACSAVDGSIALHRHIWGAAGAAAVLGGYLFATFGARLFRATVLATAFVAAFMATAPWTMLLFGPPRVERWAGFASAVGLVAAVLAYMYARAASCAVGGVAGACLVLRLWTVVPMEPAVGWALTAAAACLCGPLIWHSLTRPLVALCTAAYGVLMCLAGLQLLLGASKGQSVCAQRHAYALAAAGLVPLAALFQLYDGGEASEAAGAYGRVASEEGEDLLPARD